MDSQTDTTENITFPQLRMWVVIIQSTPPFSYIRKFAQFIQQDILMKINTCSKTFLHISHLTYCITALGGEKRFRAQDLLREYHL